MTGIQTHSERLLHITEAKRFFLWEPEGDKEQTTEKLQRELITGR